MVFKIRMPRIEANTEEGSIGRWLKAEGEWVEAGEPLVEIITDKATFELESERGGFLRRRVAPQNSVVPTGYVIALLSDEKGGGLPDVTEENEELMRRYRESLLFGAGELTAPEGQGPAEPVRRGSQAARVRATPAARKLARSEGVRLGEVKAPQDGVIREKDVLAHLHRGTGAREGGGDGG